MKAQDRNTLQQIKSTCGAQSTIGVLGGGKAQSHAQ
jgi:hypothetical protein